MAEKKTTKRTPKQPKAKITEIAKPEVTESKEEVAEPKVEGTELPADVTPFEEFEASSEVAKVSEPKVPETESEEEIAESEEEITEVIEPEVAEPEEEIAKFEKATSSKVAAKIKKLNPYLEDFQSKWIAILEVNGLTHKLFKGSYAKAFNAAENYNISHGIGKGQVIKIRK